MHLRYKIEFKQKVKLVFFAGMIQSKIKYCEENILINIICPVKVFFLSLTLIILLFLKKPNNKCMPTSVIHQI